MTENPPTETAEEAVRLNDTCLRALRVEDSKQALPGQLFLQVSTSQDELDTPSLHTHTSHLRIRFSNRQVFPALKMASLSVT